MTEIATDTAPRALGPYSQGRVVNNLVFTAGQIGLDPATMALVDDTEGQIRQVFRNLLAIVGEAGGDTSSVMKLTVYLADLAHWPLVNAVMAEVFSAPFPARTAVGVAELPLGAVIEIEAVASLPTP